MALLQDQEDADTPSLMAGTTEGLIHVYDTRTGRSAHTLRGHTDAVLDIHCGPQGTLTASNDCTVRQWDPRTWQVLWTYDGHDDGVLAVEVHPRPHPASPVLLTGSFDRTVRLWTPFDAAQHKPLAPRAQAVYKEFMERRPLDMVQLLTVSFRKFCFGQSLAGAKGLTRHLWKAWLAHLGVANIQTVDFLFKKMDVDANECLDAGEVLEFIRPYVQANQDRMLKQLFRTLDQPTSGLLDPHKVTDVLENGSEVMLQMGISPSLLSEILDALRWKGHTAGIRTLDFFEFRAQVLRRAPACRGVGGIALTNLALALGMDPELPTIEEVERLEEVYAEDSKWKAQRGSIKAKTNAISAFIATGDSIRRRTPSAGGFLPGRSPSVSSIPATPLRRDSCSLPFSRSDDSQLMMKAINQRKASAITPENPVDEWLNHPLYDEWKESVQANAVTAAVDPTCPVFGIEAYMRRKDDDADYLSSLDSPGYVGRRRQSPRIPSAPSSPLPQPLSPMSPSSLMNFMAASSWRTSPTPPTPLLRATSPTSPTGSNGDWGSSFLGSPLGGVQAATFVEWAEGEYLPDPQEVEELFVEPVSVPEDASTDIINDSFYSPGLVTSFLKGL
uniref:EF-hand domain-containing protein n=1 Tax=Eutreptiella gymnastica TaxID=73025 RepID=A0A7S1IKD9_9EUGL